MAETHPPIHVICYGDSGAGKTAFAATFPKPLLVFQFDMPDKETPYRVDPLRRVPRGEQSGEGTTAWGCPYYDVTSLRTGKLLIRVERFLNPEAEVFPDAYIRFLKRMAAFSAEYGDWATVVIDSVTFMELAARMAQQFITNKGSREPRQWWAGATDDLERMLMMRFASLPMNVVVIAHIDKQQQDFHGRALQTVSAPGRLSKGLPAAFGELYYAYPQRDADKNVSFWLQTRSDLQHVAASQIGAPDPCPTAYAALWAATA